MSGLLDSAARVVMLVLSVLATLAIVGSIAAIPTGQVAQFLGSEREAATGPTAEAPSAEPTVLEDDKQAEAAGTPSSGATPAPEPAPSPAERWLEVIAYALIAIAGLLAIIALTLMRAVHHARMSRQ